MRLDLRGLGRKLLGDAREDVLGAVLLRLRRHVGDLRVRVREGDLADVGVDGVLPTPVGALELDLDAGAVVRVPGDHVVLAQDTRVRPCGRKRRQQRKDGDQQQEGFHDPFQSTTNRSFPDF